MDTTLLWLMLAAFLAGLVDAVAGGGGLITVPALLLLKPEWGLPMLLGTNKTQSCFGTAVAAWTYAQRLRLPWQLLFWAILAAFAGSLVGSIGVGWIPPGIYKPILVFILAGVALYTYAKKDLGLLQHPAPEPRRAIVLAATMGFVIGAYDGLIGPGTGSFFILAGIALLGFDFLQASASAKVLNVATNLASVIFFALAGVIQWSVALPMAVANIAGNRLGAHLAMAKGARWVRLVFQLVVWLILLRLAWEVFGPR